MTYEPARGDAMMHVLLRGLAYRKPHYVMVGGKWLMIQHINGADAVPCWTTVVLPELPTCPNFIKVA